MNIRMEYKNLIELLNVWGFDLNIENERIKITGHGIKGFLSRNCLGSRWKGIESGEYFLVLDNKKCFNKFSDTPFFMKLVEIERVELGKVIESLGSNQAYRLSNKFQLNYINEKRGWVADGKPYGFKIKGKFK